MASIMVVDISIGDPRLPFHFLTVPTTDPTALVITVSFASALGIFICGALFNGRKRAVTEESIIPEDLADSPYHAHPAGDLATDLPSGKIPTAFYNSADLLGIGLIFLIFLGLVMASVHGPKDTEQVLGSGALVTSIILQFFLAAIAILMVRRRMGPVAWLGLRWQQWPWVFVIAPCAVFAMWAMFLMLQLGGYMRWIESHGVETVQDTVQLLQTATDPAILGLMAFAAVIAAPLCEEIVFRGYLYPAAKKFAGPWVAGVFTALVFACAHASLAALLPLFIFGLVLVFVYEKTGSLWAPIAIHFCFNGATVALQLTSRFLDLPLNPPS